ncbi:MAG TPA: circularly permuted type 2 ATP-grasp protein, partial [Ilumatobacteraceae bacterium]|nr:circularly permuted type 2 ATP-grasp protein [Ilumatobacteraceae bacterium]
KPANESGGYGILIGNRATATELADAIEAIQADPRNWVAQPILSLSTAPTLCDGQIEPRHVDLRPFILSGATSYVTAGGLTRVALRRGSLVVNSSQGGGSKDTWIVDDEAEFS